jgi:uncharacterized protein involved in exopolysaccharide biosynthesis
VNVQALPPTPGTPRQTTAREAVAVVFRRKWLILGLFFATTITVVALVLSAPTTYVSSGRVLIRRGEKQSVLLPNREIFNQWEQELGSEIELIKSTDVSASAQAMLDAEPGPKVRFSGSAVDAEVMGKSNVIAIAYTDGNPQVAERAARAVIRAYVDYRQQTLALRYPKSYFDREIARADSEVRAIIEEKRHYADATGAVEPSEQKRASLGLESGLNQKRSEAAADLASAQAEQKSMRQLQANPYVEDPTSSGPTNSPAIEELKRRVVEQQARIAFLRERYRDDAPEVLMANATLDTLRGLLSHRIQGQLAISDSKVSALEARVTSIDRDLSQVRSNIGNIPDQEARINQLDLQYSLAKDRYDDLLIKARDAAVNEVTSSPVSVVLITPAGPARPTNVRDYVRLALAPAFSLVVGVGLAFFVDGLDLTVRTAGQAEEAVDLPVLAALTERRRRIRQAS